MTDFQIKVLQTCGLTMVGVMIIQAFTIKRLSHNLYIGRQRFTQLHNGAEYLLNILEQNDIEMTEFDVIALTELLEGQTSG